jgi:hypothetical protein
MAMLGPEPEYQRPVVTSIVVGRDTVWFCADSAGNPRAAARYLWLRARREWRRVRPAGPPCTNPITPTVANDSVPIGGGITLIRVRPPADSDGLARGRSHLVVRDSVSGKVIVLEPRLAPDTVAKLAPSEDIGPDTLSTAVSAYIVTDSVVWLGLGGGFSEGQGELGGLFRVDRRTGAYRLTMDDRFADTYVTGLAVTGPWVWVGTVNPAEYGAFGDRGLLRLDGRTNRWRTYTDSTSPLPDPMIDALASDGRVLAVATKAGLAIAELVPAAADPVTAWHVGWFVPAFAGDTLVFQIGPRSARPRGDTAEAVFTVVQRFAAPGRERPFHAAIAALSRDSIFKASFEDPEVAGAALVQAALSPGVLGLLRTVDDGQIAAAAAIAALGSKAPPAALSALRAAFVALDSAKTDVSRVEWNRLRLGRALGMLRDSSAVIWARAVLEREVRAAPRPANVRNAYVSGSSARAAIELLAAVHDRTGLSLTVALAGTPPPGTEEQLVKQLAVYDTAVAWGSMLAFARAGRLPVKAVLTAMRSSAGRDAAVLGQARELITTGLAGGDDETARAAAWAADSLRLIQLAPDLIRQLERAPPRAPYAVNEILAALVSLSGRDDAPVYPSASPMPSSVVAWWKQWLAAVGGRPIAVRAADGKVASDSWKRRLYSPR